MKLDFYFDPACPFCWITSRWLIQAQSEREIDITWRPFSLAIKNNKLDSKKTDAHTVSTIAAHRVLRVIVAAGGNISELYTTFGTKRHIFGDDFTDELIQSVLAELKLPAELAQAADDTHYDELIQVSMNEATKVVGTDIGVPTIVFTNKDNKAGYFGPVLQNLPSVTESIRLWDALQALATSKDFYELKRNRPDGGPNTASTAICIP